VSARTVAVLVVLLVLLGGGALLVRQQAATQKPAGAEALGQPLLKGLQAAQVAQISVRSARDAVTLVRKQDRWGIAERDGFPADFDKVRDFVLKAITLKVARAEPIGDADRARLNLDGSGTVVQFADADRRPLATFTLGKKYFKTEPDNPDKAVGDGRYVAVAGDEKRVILIADPMTQASTKTADWISRTAFEAEKVKSLEMRDADGGAWKIERGGDNADWKLAGLKGGEKLETTKANAAAYTFGRLELADVAPKDAKPEDTGLAKPATLTATTFDGLTYVLKLGKTVGDNTYAAVAISGEPKPEGKDAAERLKKMLDRLPREKALEGYPLLIPKAKLSDVVLKRADLLVKKEEKKKK